MRAYSKRWIGSGNLCFDSREENIKFNPDRVYILYALYSIDINRATERQRKKRNKEERKNDRMEGREKRRRKRKEVTGREINSLRVN